MPTLLSLNKSIVKFFGYLEFDLDQINLKLFLTMYMSFVAAQSFLRQRLCCRLVELRHDPDQPASRCSVNLVACSQRPKWKLAFISDSLAYVSVFTIHLSLI